MVLDPGFDVGTSSPYKTIPNHQPEKKRPRHPKNGPAPDVASQVQIFVKTSLFQLLQKKNLEMPFEKAQLARCSKVLNSQQLLLFSVGAISY